MKKSILSLSFVVVSLAMISLSSVVFASDTLLAFRGGGGGGFRGSAEFHNDVNAGGRAGTYGYGARGYERGYEYGAENAYDNYGGGGYTDPVYTQPYEYADPYIYGPTLNPDQEPY